MQAVSRGRTVAPETLWLRPRQATEAPARSIRTRGPQSCAGDAALGCRCCRCSGVRADADGLRCARAGRGSRTSLRGGVRCTAGVLVRVRVRCVYATCACAVCGDACNVCVCVCGEYTRRVYMRYIVCMQNVYVAHMVYGDICVYT